jgi:outer membrane scaffolding protein for murein synthesis (MipA/OmpV family)
MIACGLLATASAHAESTLAPPTQIDEARPIWEVGFGAGVGSAADFPGADRYRVRALPFPYVVYRGQLFRSDENGARLQQKLNRNIELDISSTASFPVHSDANGPRAGMPDLDYMFELGPNLKITFARPQPGVRLLIELPLRASFSTNWHHMDYRGLVFAPDIGVQDAALLGSAWHGYADIGPMFASARLQQYFYEVAPQYALPDRPAYEADGGYMGSRLEIGLNRSLTDSLKLFAYARFDDYAGAENRDSPLLKSTLNGAGFVGFAWSFLHSSRTVNEPTAGE